MTAELPTTIAPAHRATHGAQGPGRRRKRGRWIPYILIAPTVLAILGFLVYPIASIFYYSLRRHNVTEPWANEFIGLQNFRDMLQDPIFGHSLVFSLQWVVVEVLLQFILGLIAALLLNETFVGRGVARVIMFAPWPVSGILTTTIFTLLYNPSTGIFGYLARIGIGSPNFAILGDTDTVFWGAVVAELWHGVPFFAILILAALQGIPSELYEAASVDGANRIKRFWNVTLPHLRDAIVLSTLLRVVWEFNNVDLLYSLTGGGPGRQTTTLPLYVAQKAIIDYEFGYGAALTVVGFGILFVFSLLYLRLSRFGGDKA